MNVPYILRIILLLGFLLNCQVIFAQFSNEKIIYVNEESYPRAIVCADLDGDGDLDVVSASSSDDTVAWYENDGKGNFSNQNVISMEADGVFSIFTADLDLDGDMDVLSATSSANQIAWYKNDGIGNFSEPLIIANQLSRAVSVHAGDLDMDGDMDVLSAASFDNKIAWYENDGMGNFSEQITITTEATRANGVSTADIDGDGDLDVLSASFGDDYGLGFVSGRSKIAWYENDGNANFSEERIISSFYLGMALGRSVFYPARLDTDDAIDILWAYTYDDDAFGNPDKDNIAWSKNDGNGEFSSTFPDNSINSQTIGVSGIYAADLDCDGDMDALSASKDDDLIVWYENDGNGFFSEPILIASQANGASSVYTADLDNDGDPDVLSTSFFDGKIAWYENLSKTTTSIEEQLPNNFINVSPNPFEDFISIEQTRFSTESSSLLLFDAMGKQLQSIHLKEASQQFSTAHLTHGIYFYKVVSTNNQTLTVGKLIK